MSFMQDIMVLLLVNSITINRICCYMHSHFWMLFLHKTVRVY